MNNLRQAISLFAMSPAQLAEVAGRAEYERDVLMLYSLCGPPLSTVRFAEIVKEVAAGSPHENHLVPSHLEYLLKNKWLVEGSPESMRLKMALAYPSECAFGCLGKFLALVEAEKSKE